MKESNLPREDYEKIQALTGKYGMEVVIPIIDYYHDIIGQWADADIKRAAGEITARLSHAVNYFKAEE